MLRNFLLRSGCALGLLACSAIQQHAGYAQRPYAVAAPQYEERVVGPYNVHALLGGDSLVRPVPTESEMLRADGVYTLSLWVEITADTPKNTLIAGVGDTSAESSRYLGLRDGHPMLRMGTENELVAQAPLAGDGWHFLAATFDGKQHLYVDGVEAAHGTLAIAPVAPQLVAAPVNTDAPLAHFGGTIATLTLSPEYSTAEAISREFHARPDFALLRYDEASPSWPVQTRGQAGYAEQQDPSLMPASKAPFEKPVAQPLPKPAATLLAVDAGTWTLHANWMLAAVPDVHADGATLSTTRFDSNQWMHATVPGTVLTTMVNRGIYPDPDFGLNNLAIPETLNKQNYWYRVEFETPREASGHKLTLTFDGINYSAEPWLNGHKLGRIDGAFVRGSFDVTPYLNANGHNALAVRISPPPHPGIPQEQSLKGGPGENGGIMCLDGPTFVATEGWDWIPAIRDRNTGIWQDVELKATDVLHLGDPRVVTRLPLPDTSSADVSIDVPVNNTSSHPVEAVIHAGFEDVDVAKKVTLAPGETTVHLGSTEFSQLHVEHPRLWWPNGYGKPELYDLKLRAEASGSVSDHKELTFGIREITYELSLFDAAGKLRRVEVSPTEAAVRNEQVVDVHHAAMRKTADLWAASLTPEGEHSPAVKEVTDKPGMTDLVLKVNGVRIAARGGNWGMDDSRKRVSREHLEPFFRLQREAHLNIVRNWVGQDTEETFYQLADEYGMMVWNDFWATTQDYNLEPQDVSLFLKNARDVVGRYRNHPSIVIWCARNEGVPQPILNEGLIQMLNEEDGTRYYTPGSNRINLRNSGPYKYQDPKLYYSTLDKGFSVELGIASLSTLESLQASMAKPDQWPISDAWAYHDWHQASNGDVHPLMDHIAQEFGAATDLKDFERKAQMFNYVDHRAIFEGFNQHLWAPNSGRMLWMTHPAWPSNVWQIYSSDYDTQASYYGVKKACEPLHVQLDLSDYTVAAVNTTNAPEAGVTVHAEVYSLANQLLLERSQPLDLKADAMASLWTLPLKPLFAQQGVLLVRLEMKDAAGKTLSRNLYWLAEEEDQYRKLNNLAAAKLTATAEWHRDGGETVVDLKLSNPGPVAALEAKATLVDSKSGARILPAYFSDNYVSLLPSETEEITIRYPNADAAANPKITLRGWNVPESTITIAGGGQ